jgi:hypothetical protein
MIQALATQTSTAPASSLGASTASRGLRVWLRSDEPVLLDAKSGCPHQIAEGISQLFRRQYGDQYHRDVLYNPSSISDAVEAGKWLAAVVLDSDGTTVAHGALLRGEQGVKLARIVVDSSARGRHLAERITDALLDHAVASGGGFAPVLTESVTTHPVTQRLFISRGFEPLGVCVHKFLDYFQTGQRESVLVMGRDLSSSSRVLYVPEQFKGLCSYISDLHSLRAEVVVPPEVVSVSDSVELKVRCDPYVGCGGVDVPVGAVPSHQLLSGILHRLRDQQIKFVDGRVRLDDPCARSCIDTFLGLGFSFGYLEPCRGGTNLVMQWSAEPLHPRLESLALVGAAANDIRTLMLQEGSY